MQTEPTIVIEVQEQKNEAVQPELLYSQLAAASASADALDTTMPADVPAAAEDTSEVPAVTSQHSVHDENGYYVYNGTENDTYNSLTKDGLWVGGVDDNTGFHVDNTGHASANGLDVQNQKITGVADGEFKAGSTDAVTAGQLYDAGIVPGKAADGSVAIGNGSNVTNINGVAIGNKALVNYSAENGVAIGQGAEVRTDNATAIGQGSRVVANPGNAGSVALGQGSMVIANDASASKGDTKGVVSVGLSGNNGFTRRIINVGDGVNDSDAATYGQVKDVQADVDALDALAVQYDGAAKNTVIFAGTNGTSLENVSDIVMNVENPINHKAEQHSFQNAGLLPGKVEGTATDGKWNMAIGEGSEIAVDGGTGADMMFNTAIGNSAGVSQALVDGGYEDVERSTAIGHAAKVRANNSTAIGDSSNVSKDNSVALGQKAEVQSATSIAIGQGTKIGANAENSIAIGTSANGYSVGSKAKNSTVVGVSAWSLSEGGTVLGKSAKIQGCSANGTAIGTNATINVSAGSGNVALGADSTVSKADVGGDTEHGVVSVGQSGDNGFNRRIINVANGINDTDAATVGQIKTMTGMDSEKGNVVQYDGEDKSVVTFVGENGTKLTNLADGEFKAGSKDAVTAGQLYAAGIVPGATSSTHETYTNGIAVGIGSQLIGNKSMVLGSYAAAGENAVAIGNGSGAAHLNATAVGQNSNAMANGATALGQKAWAEVENATAIGFNADVAFGGDNAVALGANTQVVRQDILDTDTNGVVSVGYSGKGYGNDEAFNRRIINVGDGVNDNDAATYGQVKAVQADIDALDELAVTYTDSKKEAVNFNKAKLQNIGDIQLGNATSTFVGSGLVNGKVYDTEKGQWAENGANATHSMAVGSKSSVRGTDSVAVGPEAAVNNGNAGVLKQSTAVGSKATVTSSFSTALGANTQAKGDYSVAIGAQSQATGANATAIGAYAAAGENSVVVGGGEGLAAPIVSKANGTAMGTYVDIKSDNGTALGYGSQIGWNGKNSVALGADSVANEEKVVSVGHTKGQANGFGGTYGEDLNRRITNVADGKNANDAATVGQISKITGMDSEKGNVVQYDGEDKSVVTFAGENGTKLTNLAAGEFKADSTDAVTAGQLYASGIVPGSIVDGSGTGKGNMALGNMSEIEAGDGMDYNTAIGYNAGISQEYVIGKGYENAENSTAIGASARIYGSDSVAVGHQSSVTHKQGVAIGQGAKVESANSVAVGHEAIIKGNAENSIAIGNSKTYDPETGLGGGATQSVASGAKNSTVIGVGGATTSEGAVVLGYEARVNGSAANATAIGKDATIQVSSGNGNVALGAESEVSKADVGDDTAHGVVSIGKSGDDGFTRRIVNVADGLNDSDAATVGQLNAMQSAYTDSGIVGGTMDKNTLATGAVAIGKDSNVHGTGSIAIGTGSKVEKHNSVAIGRNAIVKGAGSVALGASSVATEDNVLSLGRNDGSLGLRIVNMKDGINERDAVTVGQMNELAFGKRTSSLPLTNGATSLAEGINKNTTAIKSLDEQLDDVKVDWGESTQSMKELTEKASAFAAQTQNVDWNALNSVDWNAVSTMAAVPATMNIAVDDGQANEGDTGAEKDDDDRSPQTNGSNPGEVDGDLHVSGNTTLDGTLNVKGAATFEGNATFDKGATMKGDLNMSGNKITGLDAGDISADSTDAVNGSQLFDVQQQVSDNRNAIGALGSRVSDLGEEVDSVGAISAALAGLHPLDYNGTGSKFQISAALGTYDGTQAAAIGGFYHFNRDTLLSIGGSTSFEGDRKTAANIGLTFRVGEGASEAPAVQDTETKQQMDAMKQEIEMLKAELEQLKNKDTEANDKN